MPDMEETMSSMLRHITAGLAAVSFAAMAQAASAETLSLTTINAPGHWSENEGHLPFMECVKKGTNGGIDFTYFHSGQIANAANSLEALNTGLAQLSFVVPSSISEKLPLNNIPILPDMGDSVAQMVNAYRKVVNNPDSGIAKELAANGIKPLIINMFPAGQVMSRKDGYKTADSFRNKKIRIAGGSQSFAINALGAVPVQIGFGEIYLAMQQGTVDAYLFTAMTVKNFSLQEVTKAISRNGNFGTAVGLISIDSKTFAKLSPDKQKVLVDCGLKQESHMAKYADEFNGKLLDEFAGLGIDVYNFTPETKAAVSDKLKLSQVDYVARLNKQGLLGQQAFDEYQKALGR